VDACGGKTIILNYSTLILYLIRTKSQKCMHVFANKGYLFLFGMKRTLEWPLIWLEDLWLVMNKHLEAPNLTTLRFMFNWMPRCLWSKVSSWNIGYLWNLSRLQMIMSGNQKLMKLIKFLDTHVRLQLRPWIFTQKTCSRLKIKVMPYKHITFLQMGLHPPKSCCRKNSTQDDSSAETGWPVQQFKEPDDWLDNIVTLEASALWNKSTTSF